MQTKSCYRNSSLRRGNGKGGRPDVDMAWLQGPMAKPEEAELTWVWVPGKASGAQGGGDYGRVSGEEVLRSEG